MHIFLINMSLTAQEIIKQLLEIGAIQIRPKDPFTFASGIKSPIYCDGRLVISQPKLRKEIAQTFATKIKAKYPEVEIISGIATGSIAMAAWVSDETNLPMIYWRKPKGYGHNKTFEGVMKEGQKVVIIEDAISTGSSSLSAVRDLREKGANILDVFVIYSHNLPSSKGNFAKENSSYTALCSFDDLVQYLETSNGATSEEINLLKLWNQDPEGWIGKVVF